MILIKVFDTVRDILKEVLDIVDLDDTVTVEEITDQSVQHEVFRAYLEKIGVEEEEIDKIIELDDEIASRINVEEFTNIKWDIVKLSGVNFMSYEHLDISDWNENDGLYQITGLNTAGKTTLVVIEVSTINLSPATAL